MLNLNYMMETGVDFDSMTRGDHVKALNMIEKRLELSGESGTSRSMSSSSTLSLRGRVVYMLTRGDNYHGLLKFEKNRKLRKELIMRACDSYDEAERLAREGNVSVCDPLLLTCIYSRCRGFLFLKGDASAARHLATIGFNAAVVLHMDLDVTAVGLLQKLRDEFIMDRQHSRGGTGKGNASDGENDENEPKNKKAVHVAPISEEDAEEALMNSMPRQPPPQGLHDGDDVVLSPYAIAMVQKLRRLVHMSTPKRLDKYAHGQVYHSALQSIFRAYVRGNAVPGQQVLQGTKVGVGIGGALGSRTTFDQFLLGGPYLSWKGFVMVLRDFNVACRPPKKTTQGDRFPDYLWDGAPATVVKAPLSMEKATAIFIEAAKTSKPAVVLQKFEARYKEIHAEMKIDPWIEVGSWVDTQDWDIKEGLNLGQFCDALGKIGAIVYSARVFDEALPDFESKVDHFFQAHLKLMEEESWQTVVQKRLNSHMSGSDSPRSFSSMDSPVLKSPDRGRGRKTLRKSGLM